MKKIASKLLEDKKKTVPILSFPSVQLLDISVKELISSPEMQVKGMLAISNRCNIGASLNMMDLSVEAEAFGAEVVFSDDEVPTISGGIISDITEAQDIKVPQMGAGRTSLYIEGVKKAKDSIKDIPVFCGVIGPYSLAGRLFDMTELMMECFDSPDEVNVLMEKTTTFITEYIKAFKAVGADGVVIAEPAAGLLSPALAEEFAIPYMKQIVDAVSDDDFVVCYHNCGNTVVKMADSIADIGADIYHFGNAIELKDIIPHMPKDAIVMGNVDPLIFKNGTPDEIKESVKKIYSECSEYENFMLSSGCDIPAFSKWENIDAYFETINDLYN